MCDTIENTGVDTECSLTFSFTVTLLCRLLFHSDCQLHALGLLGLTPARYYDIVLCTSHTAVLQRQYNDYRLALYKQYVN